MMRYRYAVSLRVWHPSLTAEAICIALPFAPSRAWTIGEPRCTPKGQPLAGRNRETYCCFPVAEGVDELPASLSDLAVRLEPQRDVLRETWATGGRAEFFVGWRVRGGNSGDTLGPALLAQLADLGLALSLDLYPDPD